MDKNVCNGRGLVGRVGRCGVGALLALFGLTGHAATNCPDKNASFTPISCPEGEIATFIAVDAGGTEHTSDDPVAACSSMADARNRTSFHTQGGPTNGNCFTYLSNDCSGGAAGYTLTQQCRPTQCSSAVGLKYRWGQTTEGVYDFGSDRQCYNGCVYQKQGQTGMVVSADGATVVSDGWYEGTAESCEGGANDPQQPDRVPATEPPPDQCVTTSDGTEVCPDAEAGCGTVGGEYQCTASPNNCGEVDGVQRCIEDIPENGCVDTPNGGTICINSAPTPPVPDNGDGSTPAQPDASFGDDTDGDGQPGPGDVANVYNNSTVNNSYGPAGEGANTGTDGNGDPCTVGTEGCTPGTGDGTGSATGADSCETPPRCEGDAIQCAMLQQQWQLTCNELEQQFTPGEASEYLDAAGFDGGDGLTAAEYADEQLGQEVDVGDSFVTDVLGINMDTTTECPEPLSIELPEGLGVGPLSFDLGPACFLFEMIGYLVVMFSTWWALRIFIGGL